jgi:farnesyl-diphosphate farnesyltransferase
MGVDHLPEAGSTGDALAYQASILKRVSRTFALTIPSLPAKLRAPVTNAYLLCRIADTIEDDAGLDADGKREFGQRFVGVVRGEGDPETFARALAPQLHPSTLTDERRLVESTARVVGVTHRFSTPERAALERCAALMSAGMSQFQRRAGLQGLRSMREMEEYCFYVAGVVGQMLTELFCAYAPEIRSHRERLLKLAPSFGQGLQMTNILKDIWADRGRGICWLPRDQFGSDVDARSDLIDSLAPSQLAEGIQRLAVVAHGHLRNALAYTLTLPRRERGIRRFCLWAVGMAVPTLDNIYHRSSFRNAAEVKISRRQVRSILRWYGLFAGQDRLLRGLFERASARMPLSDPAVGERLEAVVRAAAARFDHDRLGSVGA